MPAERRNLVEAATAIEPILDAYQLTSHHLVGDVDGHANVTEAMPVVTRVLSGLDVTLPELIEHLAHPTGETVADLVELAGQLLDGPTRNSYLSKLRFFRDGWRIQESQLSDAIDAARQAGLHLTLSPDPSHYPTVEQAAPGGKKLKTYLVLWPGYGDEPLERVRRSKIELAGKYKRADTLTRAAGRDRSRAKRGEPPLGWSADGAVCGLYDAVTYLYKLARDEGILDVTVDPLASIHWPTRGETNRRPQSYDEVSSLWRTVILHGPDPDLDRLLIKFAFHTGARRAGALNLTLDRLDRERQSVKLLQKYGKVTEVPVCRTLLDELEHLARARGASKPSDAVFRTEAVDPTTGVNRPMTKGHIDTLHDAIRDHLEWARREGWSLHWARHHAKAEIHDIGGPAIARRFMGHSAAHVTEKYGPAGFEHVAWAVSIRTGEVHPMAEKPWWLD